MVARPRARPARWCFWATRSPRAGARWLQRFPGIRKVANRGISGGRHAGRALSAEGGRADLNPAAVVCSSAPTTSKRGGEPDIIAENVGAILDACQEAHPRMPIVLCEVMPSSPAKKRSAAQIKDLNARLEKSAKGQAKVTLVDTWTLFADAEGNAKVEEFPDLLHPNAAGYDKWTRTLRPVFARLRLGAGRQ
ncbi:MAG: hypothetical protein IPM17_15530 [Verrucomicrobia bacterium]|nr:hypothetical protein [Verrucomicrobiota bacterium]